MGASSWPISTVVWHRSGLAITPRPPPIIAVPWPLMQPRSRRNVGSSACSPNRSIARRPAIKLLPPRPAPERRCTISRLGLPLGGHQPLSNPLGEAVIGDHLGDRLIGGGGLDVGNDLGALRAD